MFEDYKTKESVVVVYTGEGKGKTSASLGLLLRALGAGWNVSYVQFVKHWEVNEHKAINKLSEVYPDTLAFHKGGKGFFNAGELSAKNTSDDEHRQAALETYAVAIEHAQGGDYDLVICDEINNAVHDGLLTENHLKELLSDRHTKTSVCVTGRNFPEALLDLTDIASEMRKIRHHFDDKYLANSGIDY